MTSNSISPAFFQLEQELRNRVESYLEPLGINPMCFTYLMYIHQHKGCRVSDVASTTRMDKASVTRSLATLGRLGYIDREIGKMDTRAFNLYLTPAGKTIVRSIRNILDEWEGDMCAALGEEERAQLFHLLERAGNALTVGRAKIAAKTAMKERSTSFFY